MHEPNVQELLRRLPDDALVLDVGGWACPFNRAQWVLDSEPHETRGFYRTFGGKPSQGGDKEWFTAKTWVRRDICDKVPFPFADKQFDFVICSHTLEDLRDPIWVCSELARVGKRGYIEVPSRLYESSRGVERKELAGLSHHRWLVDIVDQKIRFLQKFHTIHSHWRFSFPPEYLRTLPPEKAVQWLWWEGGFAYEEQFLHGMEAMEAELTRFVQETRPYPAWQIVADQRWRTLRDLGTRAIRKLARVAKRAENPSGAAV